LSSSCAIVVASKLQELHPTNKYLTCTNTYTSTDTNATTHFWCRDARAQSNTQRSFLKHRSPRSRRQNSEFGVASGPARGRQHMPRESYRIFKVGGRHVNIYWPLSHFKLVRSSHTLNVGGARNPLQQCSLYYTQSVPVLQLRWHVAEH